MAISPLASVFVWSPNHYAGRAYPITKITIHHMAGNLSAERCGEVFKSPSRQASSNYGVGSDGVIGCYVDEQNAPWTSSSYDNDNRAVTIEVADYDLDEWSPSEAAYNATIDLCVDICQRNGIEQLTYTGDPTGTMTEHMMFSNTACPGPWWHERMGRVTDEINARLRGETSKGEKVVPITAETGSVYRLYNSNTGDHLYTTDESEMDALTAQGWKYEGIAFTIEKGNDCAVYRLYNPNAGIHLLTINLEEATKAQEAGWKWEGVQFFAKVKGHNVMRLYNPSNGAYLYTTSDEETAQCVLHGWINEGIAFHV